MPSCVHGETSWSRRLRCWPELGVVGRGGSSVETFPADIFQGSDQTPEKTMTLVGRRSELPTQALSDFQIRTGVTVTTESAGGDETLLLRLAAGGYGEFDVIIVSGDALAYLVDVGTGGAARPAS